MNLVFLDFDGVLNSLAFLKSKATALVGIDPKAVARVNRLCLENNAQVVVSSTWRINRTRAQLQQLLRLHGFTRDVLGKTPNFVDVQENGIWRARERGHEIQAWLNENERTGDIDIQSFVIVDDDSDMAHLKSRHVKTQFATGITDEDVERAAAILRKPWR